MSVIPETTTVERTPGRPSLMGGLSRRWRLPRALLSKPSVIVSSIFLALIVLMAIFAPVFAKLTGWGPYDFDADAIDPMTGGLPIGGLGGISAEHWLGVEPLNGRDIFIRIAYGARVSLIVSISATLLTATVGIVLGTVAGYFGGWIDAVICRVMDFLMAFPALIFMIAILSAIPQGNRVLLLVIVLSLFGWPAMGRVIRSQAMSLRNREFVEAAIASGASKWRIVFREVLPNLTGTIIVIGTLMVPNYISTEAGLSFLGVGVTPPTASWGQMIAAAVSWYASDPMYFIIPGAFLTFTVLSFMVIGDHAENILNRRVIS